MKKTIISICLFITTLATVFAQNNSEHLTFKGVPIDGTLNEYVCKNTNKPALPIWEQ